MVESAVGRDRRADLVEPDGVRPPGVVDRGVDDEPAVGGELRAGERLGDHVRQVTAGGELAHADGVPLVAGDIDAVEQEGPVRGDLEAAEGEELVALGLDVAVEQNLLAGHGLVGVEFRRGPVVGRSERCAALDAVLLAFAGAAVVPPVAPADRYREVGLQRARLDLLEDACALGLQMGRARIRVGVLALQVRDHLGVVLVAQPLVAVLDVVAVMAADDGTGGGAGEGRLEGVGHPSTVARRCPGLGLGAWSPHP